MKSFIFFLAIFLSVANAYSQSKRVKTGLYDVISRDSCSGQGSKHTMIYQSDTLCLAENPVITVKDIDTCFTASMEMDGEKVYALNVKLNKSASLKFKKITTENVGKRFAFIIDNKIVMAPIVRDPVTSGMMTISGEKPQILKEMGTKLKEEIGQK